MGDFCITCHALYEGMGSRCPECYVKFALKRGVTKETIRRVLKRMKTMEKQDIDLALTILQEGE